MPKLIPFFVCSFLLYSITAFVPSSAVFADNVKIKNQVVTAVEQLGAMPELPSAEKIGEVLKAPGLPSEMTDERKYQPKAANSPWSSIARNSCGVLVLNLEPTVSVTESEIRNHFAAQTTEEILKNEGGMGSQPVTKTMLAKLANCDAQFEFDGGGTKVHSVLLCWRKSKTAK